MNDINKAMQICHKNGVKVYPIPGFYIEVSAPGSKPKKIDKKLTQKEVNEAITKTYIYYAKKL